MLTLTSVFLVACSLPQGSSELINSSKPSSGFCYDIPTQVVNQRINSHLNSCYQSTKSATYVAGMVIPLNVKQYVVRENLQNGNRFSVKNRQSFLITAEVLPNFQGCQTLVKTHAVTGYWKRKLPSLDAAIQGVSSSCPSNLF